MLNRSRISSASISARGITGICRRTASRISGFAGRTADDDDDHVRVADMRGLVPVRDPHADRFQPIRHRETASRRTR